MAKIIRNGKGKKFALTALAALLSASLSIGVVSACAPAETAAPEEETTTAATDTQLLRNGNFEFNAERDEETEDKRIFITTPTDWNFTSGSPSSDTRSGIVDVKEWDYLSKAGRPFDSAEDAEAHWTDDGVTLYDRLKFYEDFDVDSSSEFSLYGDYTYTPDFEDVQYLSDAGELKLHDHDKQVEAGDTSVLMIHNKRTSDNVRGTAQYYTSGTTVTLRAGTAAKVSVWVKTAALYHYGAGDDVALTKRGGAYIGIVHSVGGTALDPMQIKNINTLNASAEQNGWKQYEVYIRANTFATTTFRVVLGLGQGTTDDRFEAVDGFAFFDDVTVDVISDADYRAATEGADAPVKSASILDLSSRGDAKKFSAVDETGKFTESAYAIDLKSEFSALTLDGTKVTGRLTQEQAESSSKTFTSADIDDSLGDNRSGEQAADEAHRSFVGLTSYTGIKTLAETNGYAKSAFLDGFGEDRARYPFGEGSESDGVVLILSTNGAAYTVTVQDDAFTVLPKHRMLVSFFVKTCKFRSGATGAGAVLVDGENRTTVAAFDSTTVDTVDVNDDEKDIYAGWVQVFFFVENDTDESKTFFLELTYGPTAISDSARADYCDGYAAFAHFETAEMTTKQYGYAATGTYAQKVSLTASVKDTTKFDDPAASGTSIEKGLATPANYTGVLAGSKVLVSDRSEATPDNPGPAALAEAYGIYAGLLSRDYAKNYAALTPEQAPWKSVLDGSSGASEGDAWWKAMFGDGSDANGAYQPLAIVNASGEARPAYGYFAAASTLSASSSQRISVRVKLSENAKAYVYLTDVSDASSGFVSRLAPYYPAVTYWYDDEGNIVKGDPSADDYNEKTDVLYTLEDNGLYRKVGSDDGVYYANLHNFKSESGNLVTTDGTVAFYGKTEDGKTVYYAYYDEKTDEYSQPVENLPTDAGVRYTAPEKLPETAICVEGSAETAGKWITVTFYLRTGNEDKDYRLELWAGARDDTENGLPAGAYVLFDRCTSASVSDFDTRLSYASDTLLKTESNRAPDPADNTKKLDDKLNSDLALYYTFTFYDSADYLRYDKTLDTDAVGNPWGSYRQSSHAEQLAYLYYEDLEGVRTSPAVTMFVDYGASEVTVEEDDLGGDTAADDGADDTATDPGDVNVWLLISSGILAFVLVFVIIVLIVRRIVERVRKKRGYVAPKKRVKKAKPVKPAETKQEPAEEKPAEKDENDPYNE